MSDVLIPHQESLPGLSLLKDEIARLADAEAEERGAIYTRVEVVEFMLDLAGYTVSRPLHKLKVLEPSIGAGEFLFAIVRRLVKSWRKHAVDSDDFMSLANCVQAVELHRASVSSARDKLAELLEKQGADSDVAAHLASTWVVSGDFLVTPLEVMFDLVIGNPPYLRQEVVPDVLLAEYRRRYATMYDRADLYIAFIERSLSLLRPGGALVFICADRWMKNRYGGPLRKMVADQFNLRSYVDMTGTNAFHSDVSAYPAITVIGSEPTSATRVAYRPEIETKALKSLASAFCKTKLSRANKHVREVRNVVSGSEPWILENFEQLALVRRLESDFPTLENAECKVGIGVATGADKVFIGKFSELDVEPSRKLPLAMTRDISLCSVEWRGYGVVNPFEETGRVIDLVKYPKTKRYFEAHREKLASRHVGKKNPANWYRTIDRITPSLAARPKLLVPDIKGEAHIVYECGELYPHHNLYFIISDEWELQALRAVLLSGIARLFVSVYSTHMRGGFLRFQAQYLRRIRIPRWCDLSISLQGELTRAAKTGDAEKCMALTARLYNLSQDEMSVLRGKSG